MVPSPIAETGVGAAAGVAALVVISGATGDAAGAAEALAGRLDGVEDAWFGVCDCGCGCG